MDVFFINLNNLLIIYKFISDKLLLISINVILYNKTLNNSALNPRLFGISLILLLNRTFLLIIFIVRWRARFVRPACSRYHHFQQRRLSGQHRYGILNGRACPAEGWTSTIVLPEQVGACLTESFNKFELRL